MRHGERGTEGKIARERERKGESEGVSSELSPRTHAHTYRHDRRSCQACWARISPPLCPCTRGAAIDWAVVLLRGAALCVCVVRVRHPHWRSTVDTMSATIETDGPSQAPHPPPPILLPAPYKYTTRCVKAQLPHSSLNIAGGWQRLTKHACRASVERGWGHTPPPTPLSFCPSV